ncbi:MAG: BatA domain-containing protein, partial [Planctomycetia bacterium]|nr:BatA domain-containing protein [Planctomycetia bacterium]
MIGDVVFADPLALWAGAVAVPVALAHLYRRRRRRVAVPFVPLLREAVGPVRARGAWRRLRDALRLVARVGAVAALALALAGPRPARATVVVEDLVVVVDADPTTTARERRAPYATRLDLALGLAGALVRAHPAGRAGAVVAGDAVEVLLAPTDDPAARARAFEPAALRARQRARATRPPDLAAA